jgi:branched-chain amino acid transport system ATP-binding protein
MLTIARTLMGNPIGLLLDEPSEGLPVIVARIGELLRRLRDMGVTVLLAEQNMHFCRGIASPTRSSSTTAGSCTVTAATH